MWQARWMLSLSLLAVRAFQAPRSSVGRRTTRGLAASTLPAEVVFENINVFGLVKRTMAAATHLKPGTLKKVAKAMPADDFVAVVAFFLVLDPALNLMWRLRGGSRSFNDSWFGTLRPALKLLSSVFGTLYALDVLYCASCLIGNPLPNVIPAVAAGIGYTAVGGVLTTSIKDRFLEPRLMPVSGRSSRARNFAVKRGSGIAIWLVCILICLETLRIEAGVSVKSIIGLTSIFGIATGFAVKDIASNWVGGLLLFATRPFVPGDKIALTSLPQSVVERIGWYATRVRSDNDQVLIVPNSKFVSNKISNLSRRRHRSIRKTFHIAFEDLPKCGAIIEALRAKLKSMPDVDENRRLYIYIKELRETDVEIECEVHWRGVSSQVYRQRRTESLLAIGEVVREAGASFAVWDGVLTKSGILDAPNSRQLDAAPES